MDRTNTKFKRLADPDRERFTEWVKKSHEKLSRAARVFGRSSDVDAADIVQETLMGVLQHWEEFDSYDKFLAYCLVRVRWRALDFVRNRARHSRERLESDLSDTERAWVLQQPDNQDPEGMLMAEQLMSMIKQLPPRSRQVLLLSANGLNSFEIAKQLGITPASVRSLLRHARYRLAASEL
jgi:RNA polymerase sigma factor (sigma-70 family)